MSADIFISFASMDVKVALTLCQAIESRGFNCWISARDIQPGENFQVAIVRALRRAKILLLVFTANSNTSEEMTKELALASQQKMMVIPLRVEDVTPGDAFAYEFATRQWIDAFADWEFSIEQLCKRIGHALAGREDEAAAMPLPTVSLKPPEAEEEAAEVEEPPVVAAPPPAVKPTPAPKPAPAPKAAKAPPPPPKAPATDDDAEADIPSASGVRRWAVAAAVLALLAGAAVTATVLMQPRTTAIAEETPAIAAQALVDTPTVAEVLPVTNEVAEVAVEEAPVEKPKPVARKRAPVQAAPAGPVDIPY